MEVPSHPTVALTTPAILATKQLTQLVLAPLVMLSHRVAPLLQDMLDILQGRIFVITYINPLDTGADLDALGLYCDSIVLDHIIVLISVAQARRFEFSIELYN